MKTIINQVQYNHSNSIKNIYSSFNSSFFVNICDSNHTSNDSFNLNSQQEDFLLSKDLMQYIGYKKYKLNKSNSPNKTKLQEISMNIDDFFGNSPSSSNTSTLNLYTSKNLNFLTNNKNSNFNQNYNKKRLIKRLGDWKCFYCKNINFCFRTKCNICHRDKI